MSDAIFSGRGIFGNRKHAPYDVLAYLEPGLMLDIGASNGYISKLMLKKSPKSTVIAFEPFPGNIPLLRKNAGADERIQIIEKAVSDDERAVPFHVASTVTTPTLNWDVGYSSLGYIITDKSPARSGTVISVPTVRVDDAIGSEHVRFMKVDVQGGENSVLRSARRALSEQRIDVMHIEFSGERDVFDILQGHGLMIFDSGYTLIPCRTDPDLSSWDITGDIRLSTGRAAYRSWPSSMPTTSAGYLDFLEQETKAIGTVSTDLLCVSPNAWPAFLSAAVNASSSG